MVYIYELWLVMNSKASLGLTSWSVLIGKQSFSRRDEPIIGLHGYLLIDKFTTFLENEMTPLGLASLTSTESGDQGALRVREKGVRQFLL